MGLETELLSSDIRSRAKWQQRNIHHKHLVAWQTADRFDVPSLRITVNHTASKIALRRHQAPRLM
jgi:hypothetical protein